MAGEEGSPSRTAPGPHGALPGLRALLRASDPETVRWCLFAAIPVCMALMVASAAAALHTLGAIREVRRAAKGE